MALTWLILFPLGAAFIRLLDNHIPNAFMMHRGLQLFAVCLAIIGMSLGIWVSGLEGTVSPQPPLSLGPPTNPRASLLKQHFTTFHQYFGVILVGTLFVQGALGQLHHMEFRATGKRSFWSYGHIWFGRTVIVLGIINGGIGLAPYMANASRGQVVAYSVVAVLVVGTYVLFFVLKQRKKNGGVHRRV